MKLYTKESQNCHLKLQLEAGETLPQEEVDRIARFFISTTLSYANENNDEFDEGVVSVFKLALTHPQIDPDWVVREFIAITAKEKVYLTFNSCSLMKYILENSTCGNKEQKTFWISCLYQNMLDLFPDFGKYDPISKQALPFLPPVLQDHLEYAHQNKPAAPIVKKAPYKRRKNYLTDEQYREKMKSLMQGPKPDLHQAWLLAEDHDRISEAIQILRQDHRYLSLVAYARNKYGETLGSSWRVEEYSKLISENDLIEIIAEGIEYHLAEAKFLKERDGEKHRHDSGYWKHQLIYAGCLEEDRLNYTVAAKHFAAGGQIDRAARLCIKHNLPDKLLYLKKAVDTGFYETFLPLLKELDLQHYKSILPKIESTIEKCEKNQAYEYCAELATAMEDSERAKVFEEASKYFEYMNVP